MSENRRRAVGEARPPFLPLFGDGVRRLSWC